MELLIGLAAADEQADCPTQQGLFQGENLAVIVNLRRKLENLRCQMLRLAKSSSTTSKTNGILFSKFCRKLDKHIIAVFDGILAEIEDQYLEKEITHELIYSKLYSYHHVLPQIMHAAENLIDCQSFVILDMLLEMSLSVDINVKKFSECLFKSIWKILVQEISCEESKFGDLGFNTGNMPNFMSPDDLMSFNFITRHKSHIEASVFASALDIIDFSEVSDSVSPSDFVSNLRVRIMEARKTIQAGICEKFFKTQTIESQINNFLNVFLPGRTQIWSKIISQNFELFERHKICLIQPKNNKNSSATLNGHFSKLLTSQLAEITLLKDITVKVFCRRIEGGHKNFFEAKIEWSNEPFAFLLQKMSFNALNRHFSSLFMQEYFIKRLNLHINSTQKKNEWPKHIIASRLLTIFSSIKANIFDGFVRQKLAKYVQNIQNPIEALENLSEIFTELDFYFSQLYERKNIENWTNCVDLFEFCDEFLSVCNESDDTKVKSSKLKLLVTKLDDLMAKFATDDNFQFSSPFGASKNNFNL